ncbi:protein ALTERED PHOSPHATE STARVATION RESPONSE 1-like isoform X2 [Prosopis cineraria]|uniref:protein ALTERED PHOSPHATE STARVATION RESPONSE 1-like isoform X2 n=1 Tax=Prosopis cineraria TaxID=364024 RepID=UPI00240EAE7B|nr:protein ALTERED PHOSPHATE STARVATION RESPONSE 1-like isoform X2 [Prosopis cineraria]
MGCASSKLDDLPAVALCRQRCSFLDEAIHQRYALSAAHIAYINSLQSIGHSLHRFIQVDFTTSSSPPSSPELNLPPSKKVDSVATATAKQVDTSSPSPPHHSHSNSGSHLHFQSDSDEDEVDHELDSLHYSGHSSPLHAHPDPPPINYIGHSDRPGLSSFPGGGYMHMNFMKNKATSSVVFEQKPISPETVYMGESSSSSFFPYPYPGMNPNSSYSYSGYSTYGSGGNGYYASSSSPLAASTSKPPPPPSPPRASTWDFIQSLNFFDNDDRYDTQYTPSRDSKEVREEEGIPDLEDEDYRHEVVKEVHGDQKLVDGGAGNHSKPSDNDEVDRTEASLYQTGPNVSMENDGLEYEVHVVDKKVVDKDERSKERGGGAAFRGRRGTRDASEVAREIEAQFRRASESGTEIAKMLEAGKLPYNKKYGAYQASSKMLHAVAPSLSMVPSQPSTSKNAEPTSTIGKAGPSNLGFDDDIMMRSRNLSSTLQKLYLWEKKLYTEVKAEEKMRVMHDKKCHKLKRMDERGADFHKVDSTQTLVRSLSTKIRMAIQVVDKISMTINKIRDEELWPQLNELIHGLTRMWKSMLECHRNQCEAIREARILGSIGSRKKGGDGHLLATKELEQELINWTFQFSSWISAQKGYVRALNNWLLKCLLYEPEETPDGIVPFSPSRIGAPPIFVICNQWSQALERISEKEVVDSMHVFTMSVLQIWEQDRLEMHQQLIVNKDLERKVRNLDKDDQRIQKQIQALERQMVLASGEGKGLSVSENIIYQSDKSSSLQASLQRIFEAMERFTENSVRAYEELLRRSIEERAAREHGTVS